MASAWGTAWGSAWGNAWGTVATTPPEVHTPTGAAYYIPRRPKKRPVDEDLPPALADLDLTDATAGDARLTLRKKRRQQQLLLLMRGLH